MRLHQRRRVDQVARSAQFQVALRNQDIDGFASAAAADPDFVSIATSALALARTGKTSLAEAIRVSGDSDY